MTEHESRAHLSSWGRLLFRVSSIVYMISIYSIIIIVYMISIYSIIICITSTATLYLSFSLNSHDDSSDTASIHPSSIIITFSSSRLRLYLLCLPANMKITGRPNRSLPFVTILPISVSIRMRIRISTTLVVIVIVIVIVVVAVVV